MEARFHELEHESEMRLLKTHCHTPERRGYEADQQHQEKKEIRRPIRKGQKNVKENHRHITPKGGALGEFVQGKAKNRSSATTSARGG